MSPSRVEFAETAFAFLCVLGGLAQREGINVLLTPAPGLQTPIEGVPLWLAKLRAECYSKRTVHMYEYPRRRYLKNSPALTI